MDTIPTDGGDLNLTDSETMAHALEGVFAIPTCLTPGCDGATEAFTDSCTGCIAGDGDVYVEIDGGAA